MRILLSSVCFACSVLTAAVWSGAASAADLDYEYGAPPPHYRAEGLPPPVEYEPAPRPYYRPYAYREPVRREPVPYAYEDEDDGYRRPHRPVFRYGPYSDRF